MKRVLIILAVVTVVLVAAGVAGADQSYTDPAGDADIGTDLIGAVISNDAAGTITIKISTVNPLVSNHVIFLLLDADKNSATGVPGVGADFAMYAFPNGFGRFGTWSGSTFVTSSPATFRVSATGSTQQFMINRTDLRNTAGFNFAVSSLSVDSGDLNYWDSMPDAGLLGYDLVIPQCSNGKDDDGDGKIDTQDLGCSSPADDNESDDPVHVKLGAAKTTPLHPKAGGKAIVSAAATRVETSQPLDSGSVACSGKVAGGAALRGAGSLASGRAQCAFKIPKTAKAKMVRGKITVTYQTAPPATTPFAFKTAAK